MQSRFQLFFFLFIVYMLPTHEAYSAVVISNFKMTSTSLTFDLVGTIDDVVGSNATDSLFVGQLGSNAWFNGDQFQYGFLMGSWTTRSGTLALTSALIYENGAVGDYIVLSLSGGTINYQDTIDGTFSVTSSQNAFNHEVLDMTQWAVSAGYNTIPLPDASTNTAAAITVPEPTSLAALFVGGMLVMRRRTRATISL